MSLIVDPSTLNLAFGEVTPVQQLSSGLHCTLKTCPSCKNDKWKCAVNLENGWVFCQVCRKRGIHIFQLIPNAEAQTLRAQMWSTKETTADKPASMPPIPNLCVTLDTLFEESPGVRYLRSRRVEPYTAFSKGILWKPWGVAAWHKNGKPVFDSLQGLIHPMYRRGELVAWQFEAVPRIPGSNLPKYVTAPGSALGASFFNFDTVAQERHCAVVEGVYDALRLPFNGVAICKDTLSQRQVKLLSTCNFKEIVLLLDNDRSPEHVAGELRKLKAISDNARAVVLTRGDPADHHEDELTRLLGWMPDTNISQVETLRLASLSLQELAAERSAKWLKQ